MKIERLRFQIVLGIVIILGTLFFLNACGGGSGATVSPPPQSAPSTPQTQPPAPSSPSPAPSTRTPAPSPAQPSTPPPAAQPSPAPSTGNEIEVRLQDNIFPKEIRVKAGSKVVFVITNTASNKHSFEITDFKVYQEIKPGSTERVEWVVPDKKGEWDMGCFLTEPGGVHEGMAGKLIIE